MIIRNTHMPHVYFIGKEEVSMACDMQCVESHFDL